MLDDVERAERRREAKQKYKRSEKGKASIVRYRKSAANKAAQKRYQVKYRQSDLFAAARKRYLLSDKGKAMKVVDSAKRRVNCRDLDEFDAFVLKEAARLRILRSKTTGFSWDIDHITPVSRGGSSAHSNIQVVPASWNRTKSNKHSQRFFAA